jgi:small subunit ribosomal protein S17
MPRAEKEGFVVSAKATKTRIVAVATRTRHKKYQKVITKTKRYPVHDVGVSGMGDFVRIREARPTSKKKRWDLVSILKKVST